MRNSAPWGSKGNWLYFNSVNEKSGIAPFKQHSFEYDDFVLFFLRYKRAKPVTFMDEDYLRKGLFLFQEFQKKKLNTLAEQIRTQRDALPIKQYRSQIIEAVKNNRVILIAADTGAGKSTQVPQYLMEEGFDRIAVTQPRRIACYSLAKRVKQESLNRYGTKVAYQVRFDGTKSVDTRVLFLTEGILLKQFSIDPLLMAYNVIIIDEVHERHMSCDFLLGILKGILNLRLDLKVILMSATIQADLFSQYFDSPVIQIPGKMFNVKITYISVEEKDKNLIDPILSSQRKTASIKESIQSRPIKLKVDSYLKILKRIDDTISEIERGDLLVFVSGMNEISILSEALNVYAAATCRWIILPLHSSLSVSEQEKVFDIAPEGVRKCIISTNIAETSVTIDGIRFIIDSGKVKELGFDSSLGLSKLKEYWISKSSAKQRSGRAGRTGPGECYRLYSKEEFDGFNDFPVPEIQRINLDSIVLQIFALELGSPFEFDFLERPSEESISNSISKLTNIGGLADSKITEIGKVLSALPIDIVLGKMLVLGSISSLLKPVLAIAALLSIQNPFIRISDGNQAMVEKRKSIFSLEGDPFTLLNLFNEWLSFKDKKIGFGQSRKMCISFGVEEQRLYEAVKLKDQFEKILQTEGIFAFQNISSQVQSNEDLMQQRKQKKILEKRKLESQGNNRKLLKMDQSYLMEVEEDDDNEIIPEIAELEFLLQKDTSQLLQDSNVSALSIREFTILKLIMCSGLYPNIAIPDEANYARPSSEQVFHSKYQRFLSLFPDSVFTYNPELLHGKQHTNNAAAVSTEMDLSKLHQKRINRDILCYVSILETSKPYLMNVFRVNSLPLVLIFANSIIISSDCLHLLVDDWLHLEFFDAHDAETAIKLGGSIRYQWDMLIKRKLRPSLDKNIPGPGNWSDFNNLTFIPPHLRDLREKWIKTAIFEDCSLVEEEVMDQIIDFVELDLNYNIEKLKKTSISELLGYDPFSESFPEDLKVHLTPHYLYLLKKSPTARIGKILKLPDFQTKVSSISKIDFNAPEKARQQFECPNCFKSLLLFNHEVQNHLDNC